MTSPSAFYLARALTQWSLPPLPQLIAPPDQPGALPNFPEALVEIDTIAPTLVSLDLFDTLLFRQGISTYLQEKKTTQFIRWQLRQKGVSAPDEETIQQLRRLASEQLSAESHEKGQHGEYTLAELLSRTVSLCLPDTPPIDSNELGQRACNFEITEELAHLTPIVGAPAFLSTLSKRYRLICVTDTPLTKETITQILENTGIGSYFEAVYVSSHEGKNKRSGSIFDWVTDDLKVSPASILHLGDNPISDLASPLAHGWHARLLRHKEVELAYRDAEQRVALACAFGTPEYLQQPLHLECESSAAFLVGKQSFSLAFALFALELIKLDQLHQYRKIYFISRDGYLLKETFSELATHVRLFNGAETSSKATYLHLSRLSTLCPVGEKGIEQAMHYSTLVNGHQSGLGLFATLGFDIEKYRNLLLEEGCTEVMLQSLSPDTLARIYSLALHDTPVRKALLSDLHSKRELMEGYLRQHNFFGTGKVLFVDIGWRYRIAANLCEALADQPEFPELHCLLFGNTGELSSPLFHTHPGFFYDAARDNPLEQLVFHHKELIEHICTTNHGTCLGYRRDEGRIEAILAATEARPALRDDMQKGIVAGVREFAETFNHHPLDTSFHLAALTNLLRPFMDRSNAGYAIMQSLQQPSGANHARMETNDSADAHFLHSESRSYLPDKLPPIHIQLGSTSLQRPHTEPLERLLGLIQHLSRNEKPIVLWGLGLIGKLLYPHIKEKLILVVDMDCGLHGKQYEGHTISPPVALQTIAQGSFMVLFSPLSRALPATLKGEDIVVLRASDWLHPENG